MLQLIGITVGAPYCNYGQCYHLLIRRQVVRSIGLCSTIQIKEELFDDHQKLSSGLGLEIMLTPGQTGRIGESETK
jgi:hypothetical protein